MGFDDIVAECVNTPTTPSAIRIADKPRSRGSRGVRCNVIGPIYPKAQCVVGRKRDKGCTEPRLQAVFQGPCRVHSLILEQSDAKNHGPNVRPSTI